MVKKMKNKRNPSIKEGYYFSFSSFEGAAAIYVTKIGVQVVIFEYDSKLQRFKYKTTLDEDNKYTSNWKNKIITWVPITNENILLTLRAARYYSKV